MFDIRLTEFFFIGVESFGLSMLKLLIVRALCLLERRLWKQLGVNLELSWQRKSVFVLVLVNGIEVSGLHLDIDAISMASDYCSTLSLLAKSQYWKTRKTFLLGLDKTLLTVGPTI